MPGALKRLYRKLSPRCSASTQRLANKSAGGIKNAEAFANYQPRAALGKFSEEVFFFCERKVFSYRPASVRATQPISVGFPYHPLRPRPFHKAPSPRAKSWLPL